MFSTQSDWKPYLIQPGELLLVIEDKAACPNIRGPETTCLSPDGILIVRESLYESWCHVISTDEH
jgi:hypothetical protein